MLPKLAERDAPGEGAALNSNRVGVEEEAEPGEGVPDPDPDPGEGVPDPDPDPDPDPGEGVPDPGEGVPNSSSNRVVRKGGSVGVNVGVRIKK
jgi:hypothetical protein